MELRLLIVDDDRGFRETVRALLLRQAGVTVVGEAESGEEAVRLAGTLRPDVVLMDLAMPRMNGLEATRRLKASWPAMVVVIISVHEDEVYRRTSLSTGAEAFLVKRSLGVDLWATILRVTKREPARPM